MSTEVDIILRKYKPGRREDLIPLLQEIQDDNGYLSEDTIIKVGAFIGLSTTKIYGLATFYDQFRFVPAGKIQIKICHGTTCFLNGSQAIINKIKEETGLMPGQTGRDGIFSYDIVTCMGGCNNGPVVSVNGEYHPHIKPEQLPELIRKLRYIIEND
ncbi:MAG: NAD(P)H-dependent oxidoreductase subunit E [Bacteroidales bacterium]|jgi:NADH-quinone oxidoreductase subunit E|nr:NAD(P)H-dependent oxidoreductase subunit E [Bacteroidales bacterium]